MQNKSITEEFAKNILRTCYSLDARLGEIESICAASCDEGQSGKLKQMFSSLTTMIGADIMVPIYMEHSHLGRVMEPGPWLDHSPEQRKFGIRD